MGQSIRIDADVSTGDARAEKASQTPAAPGGRVEDCVALLAVFSIEIGGEAGTEVRTGLCTGDDVECSEVSGRDASRGEFESECFAQQFVIAERVEGGFHPYRPSMEAMRVIGVCNMISDVGADERVHLRRS